MTDANYIQQRMQEIQKDQSFAAALGKILSGRAGYNPVIEMKKIPVKCVNCGIILEEGMKFCPECGTKVEKPEKKVEQKEN
jgi:rRNA maturation endonuclease Nob1